MILKNREDFSLFKRIVERAGEMDFLSSRGSRTFYPAINSGVESFLKERGYTSVEELPVELCDTLVKACLVDNSIKYTYNFSETEQINNELDLPLIIVTNGDTVDANGMTLSVINRRSAIINELKNDSVDNGVVHPVDRVLIPNTSLGSSLLDDNHDEFTIYYEALSRTGLLDSLIHYRDDSYEIWKENYPSSRPEFIPEVSSTRVIKATSIMPNVRITAIRVLHYLSFPMRCCMRSTAIVLTPI